MRDWVQAARPLAQVNIAVPLLVGEALAIGWMGSIAVWPLVLVHAVGIAVHLHIVFSNDVADEAGDRDNTTFNAFSGGSRVLAQGKLEVGQLVAAARAMGALVLIGGVFGAVWLQRPWLLGLLAAALVLPWAYSFAPLRLSHRGWGELAQGAGVGVVLPLMGWYAQAGSFDAFPWAALAPMFLLGFASNITTALPDEPADRACDKRTWPVRYGTRRARKHSLQLLALAVFMTPFVLPGEPKWVWACIEAGPVLALLASLRNLNRAEPDAPRHCRNFIILHGLAANLLMLGWAAAALAGVAAP